MRLKRVPLYTCYDLGDVILSVLNVGQCICLSLCSESVHKGFFGLICVV